MSVAASYTFMGVLRAYLVASVAECLDAGVVVYYHGETDPDEDVKEGVAKCLGVSVLIFELGGEADEDVIPEQYAVQVYVDTTKRNRRKDPELRLASEIRDDIMRAIHRAAELRDNYQMLWDTRVKGWKPLDDGEYVAYQITLERKFHLT